MTKTKEGKGETARITFAMSTGFQNLEDMLHAALKKQGGLQKIGPAPRGPIEREAQKLLGQLAKKKKQ